MNRLNQVFSVFVIFCVINANILASYTYITTGSGKVVKVDVGTGTNQIVASLPASISPDVRGIACDDKGNIYLGTTWLSDVEWENRVIKITPLTSGNSIIESFTSPIGGYGVGQIGFNTKGELFAAGSSIYKYNQNGELNGTMGSNAYVSLFIDGDTLFSLSYFSPYTLLRYDTSGLTPVGGVIAQLQFPYDYCPTSITKSHTGNLAIGFSSVNHAGWTELWEYNLQTNTTHKLFDCSGPSGFSQYDPFTNTYLVGGTGLNIFDTQGNLIKTINNLEWGSVRLISGTFVPEPCTLLLLAVGGVMLRKR